MAEAVVWSDAGSVTPYLCRDTRVKRVIQDDSRLSWRAVGSLDDTFLHGLMKWSVKRGWAHTNPVAAVDRPPVEATDPDIRFLTLDEVEAVIRQVPDDLLGPTDRMLYLAAAMCGARQGELVALRWRDVDWTAAKIRVRRKRYRGEDGRPKSRRGRRSIPLADRLARELELHFQRSAYQADDDLVFPHPRYIRRKAPRGRAGSRSIPRRPRMPPA